MSTLRPLNIGVVTNYHLENVGGAEEALDQLATLWNHSGHRVTLFSASPRHRPPHPRLWNPTYRTVSMPRVVSTRFGLSRYARYLEREHADVPFDIISASDAYWAGHVVRMFSQRKQVPYVVYSHGSDCMEGSRFLKKPTCLARMQAVIKDADGIACISSYMQDRLCGLATPTGCVKQIVNGWPDEWANQRIPERRIDGQYLFAIGRVIQRKGFQVLVDAFARLRPKQPQVGLIIAGDGPYLGELIHQANSLKLSTTRELPKPGESISVCFPGFVRGETKRSLVGHATLGVCPSIWQEPQGMVLLEMLSQGVPVIASNVGGIPDVIQPGINGDLFSVGDSGELASKLDILLSDPTQRDSLAEQAALSVEQCRWSHVAEAHLQLFLEAITVRNSKNQTRRAA